ncbi:hypothetical protein ACU045_12210 [Microbacterium sp. MAHUQ-60]|uniref:hypothetical protein n=1 Tax=unclassified Microbacterium TaxID=2609290 RepID=UPI003618E103
MNQPRTPVRPEILQRWAESAVLARTIADVHARCTVPLAGSQSAQLDDLYPRESYSQWAREGVRSALDHMLLWADITIPTDERGKLGITHQGFRWFHTLSRAAMEGAAQSLWLTRANNSGEAIARLIRAVRDDLREQRLAYIAKGDDVRATEQRIEWHAARAQEWKAYGPAVDRMPTYVEMIRLAAPPAERDPGACEAAWRTASAAAHGKTWAILDLQTMTSDPIEWRPGQFHTQGVADQDRLTETIDIAMALVATASAQLLLRNGFDPTTEYQRSAIAVGRRSPMKDGGALVEELAKKLGIE